MAAGGRLPPGTAAPPPRRGCRPRGHRRPRPAGVLPRRVRRRAAALGSGVFTRDDLARTQAEWVDPLAVDAWGHTVHTTPPPSQGYLTLAAAAVADGLALPDDPDDPAWAHLLVEAARSPGSDRALLHDGADPAALLDRDRLDQQRSRIDPAYRAPWPPPCGPAERPSGAWSTATAWGHADPVERLGVGRPHRRAGHRRLPPRPRHRLHPRRRPPGERCPGRHPPHTLSPRRWSPGPTDRSGPCSARWAATCSPRSSCSSSPAAAAQRRVAGPGGAGGPLCSTTGSGGARRVRHVGRRRSRPRRGRGGLPGGVGRRPRRAATRCSAAALPSTTASATPR